MPILLVALGGVIGSLLRWQITELSPNLSFGVFLVNQFGVLLAGIVAYRMNTTINQRLFWINGFAGGFTTLSSLAFVLQGSALLGGVIYATVSLILSVLVLRVLHRKAMP